MRVYGKNSAPICGRSECEKIEALLLPLGGWFAGLSAVGVAEELLSQLDVLSRAPECHPGVVRVPTPAFLFWHPHVVFPLCVLPRHPFLGLAGGNKLLVSLYSNG